MNNLIPFKFESHDIQVIVDDSGEFHFIAKEVSGILGYSDAFEMTKHLDDDEKQNRQIAGFGPRGVTVISESGLYSSILGSNKPEAKPFKRWVTHDVIPTIRKTGGYAAPGAKSATPRVSIRYKEAESIMRSHLKMCKMLGVSDNMAKVVTAKQVKLETGLDCTPMLAGHTATEDIPMTPKALAVLMGDGMSSIKVNLALIAAGLQDQHTKTSVKGKVSKEYTLTDAGKAYGSMEPFQGEFNGHVGYRPMWSKRVIEVITPFIGSNVVALVGSTA